MISTDYVVQTEKTDQLEEYVKSHHSPWHLDYSWSQEARQLREMAVKSPWLVDAKYVHNYFKTLKIVDKNVSHAEDELRLEARLHFFAPPLAWCLVLVVSSSRSQRKLFAAASVRHLAGHTCAMHTFPVSEYFITILMDFVSF